MRGGIQPRVRPDREHTLDAPFTGVRISWLMVARKSPLPGGRPRFGGSFFAEGQEQFVVLNDEAPQAEEIGAGSVAVFSRNKAKVIVKERESSLGVATVAKRASDGARVAPRYIQ